MPWRSMVIRPSTTVSSTVAIRLRSLVSLAFTTASAATRSVMSRVISPKARKVPSGAADGGDDNIGQKARAILAHALADILEAAGRRGDLELTFRPAGLDSLRRVKQEKCRPTISSAR